jgi:hypothetical protein
MKIELKNLKVAASLSEETTAYTATIYIDGARAFDASNRGHGGCDLYRAVEGYTGPSEIEINQWLKANTPQVKCLGTTLDNTLELVVGDLLEQHERRKILDRYLRSRITVIVQGKSGGEALATYPTKYKPTPANIAAVAARLKVGEVVINGNPAAYDRALALI